MDNNRNDAYLDEIDGTTIEEMMSEKESDKNQMKDNDISDNEANNEETEEKINWKKELFSWIKIFVAALLIATILDNFIIINANVPSGSMENTIMTGDRMIGNRLAYINSEPQRGDVIIFKFPDNEEENFVKRVIGLPGEKVTIKESKIYIDDSTEPLEEDYLPEEWTSMNDGLEYEVPADSYFVLGDNRNISNDARYWNNTYVSKDAIIAKAIFVYWPFGNAGIIEDAEYSIDK